MNRFAAALREKCCRGNRLRGLCFVVGVTALAVMVVAAGPSALWHAAVALRWWVPMVVAVWGVGYLLNALSWRAIIRCNVLAAPLPFWRLFRFTVTGFAINYITPFGLLGGEPYRVVELRPYLGLERATGGVILYMMMHVCSHLLFWIAACAVAVVAVGVHSAAAGVVLTLVAAVCGLLVWLFFKGYRAGLVVRAVEAIKRWPVVGRRLSRLSESTMARLRMVDDNISALRSAHPRAFWTSLSLEFLSRMVNCVEVWVVLSALGVAAGYVGAFLVVAFSSLFANVLFFSPLQLGTREGGLLLAMQAVLPATAAGTLLPAAVALSLTTRVREFIWIAVGMVFMRFRNPAIASPAAVEVTTGTID